MDILHRAETRRTSLYQMMAEIRKRVERDTESVERDTERLESLEAEVDAIEELTSELEMVADRLAALLDGHGVTIMRIGEEEDA